MNDFSLPSCFFFCCCCLRERSSSPPLHHQCSTVIITDTFDISFSFSHFVFLGKETTGSSVPSKSEESAVTEERIAHILHEASAALRAQQVSNDDSASEDSKSPSQTQVTKDTTRHPFIYFLYLKKVKKKRNKKRNQDLNAITLAHARSYARET